MTFAKILREPLLHFLLLGLGLFVLYGQVSPGDREGKRIVVSQAQVDDLVRQYRSLWNRPPGPAELRSLVDAKVRDEILYREGRAMGLDRDDSVITRRVRQKYDLITEDATATAAPTDAELEAWRVAHPGAFTQPAVVSFEQVFFDPARASPADVDAARAALVRGATAVDLGQPSLLPAKVSATPLNVVGRDFGEVFAAALATAPIGQWAGPLRSGYGVHLVRLSARTAPQRPPLDQVRAVVTREWENDRRIRARDANYAKLRSDYDVVIAARLPGSPAR